VRGEASNWMTTDVKLLAVMGAFSGAFTGCWAESLGALTGLAVSEAEAEFYD
jgi:hypothetical protein